MDDGKSALLAELENGCAEYYPLHMPGHKRRLDPTGGRLPSGIDTTEVTGMDNLHDATGMIAEAERRTAELYGSEYCRYLVNGSTVGILSAIRSVCSRNGSILVARNCHASVWHSIELMNLTACYLLPQPVPDFGIYGSIRPEDVRRELRKHREIQAVVITSPTYEGILSDIHAIADICHQFHTPLIVDEAHGAHLGIRFPGSPECPGGAADGSTAAESLPTAGEYRRESGQGRRGFWPSGAVAGGADIVIQSAHKTLPSLTQTAWMHVQGDLVKIGRIDHELDVFETSSPSYPLLVSLDAATALLRERGETLLEGWKDMLYNFYCRTAGLQYLRVLDTVVAGRYNSTAQIGKSGSSYAGGTEKTDGSSSAGTENRRTSAIFARDPGKILVNGRQAGLTGEKLAQILREKYRFETEMAMGWNVLAMTGMADDPDEIRRFADALLETDTEFCREAADTVCDDTAEPGALYLSDTVPETDMTIAQAMEETTERIPVRSADGHIAAEYLWAYPPGIPLLVPGEKISKDIIRRILALESTGTVIHHLGRGARSTGNNTILTVSEDLPFV